MANCNQPNCPINGNQNASNTATENNNEFITLQNARKDLIGELDALIQYDDHYHSATNALAKATWEDIRKEEMVHVGELLGLINYLAPYQEQLVASGLKEFQARVQKELR